MTAPAAGEADAAAALASVKGLGPRTLRRLLDGSSPGAAWSEVADGHADDVSGHWRHQAQAIDPREVGGAHRRAGIGVVWWGSPDYPQALADDPDSPGVLFARGSVGDVGRLPAVAIVGTRSATRYGLGVASQLGSELASAGVSVVSGLALGIDGAAHEGACAGCAAAGDRGGPPLAVVAGGLDRPYPARHAALWDRVAEAGAVVSTSPIGVPLDRWRFPQRNRLIAALSQVVVVVEAHLRGGALVTAEQAAERGRLVGAVPGSIRSPASAGSNALLASGAFPVCAAADIQTALDLMGAVPGTRLPARPLTPTAGRRRGEQVRARPGGEVGARPGRGPSVPPAHRPDGPSPSSGTLVAPDLGGSAADGRSPEEAAVLAAVGQERWSLEQLLDHTGLSLGELCTALERLGRAGRLVCQGGWWERA